MRHGITRRTTPFVSFLTTAYGTEQYVGETIESVLRQTRTDWELIVVDNGNSDEMARVVGKYTHDPRITLIRQDNKGYTGGVCAAAAAATGRYLCVLDSDDTIEPRYCEMIGALIDSDPGIDAVGCSSILFCDPDDGQKPNEYFASVGRRSTPDPARPASFHELLDEGVPHYVGVIRREAWDSARGYAPVADVEPDVALWLRLVSAGRDVRILPQTLIRTRTRDTSLSHDKVNIEAFEDRLERAFVLAAREYGLNQNSIDELGMLRRLRYRRALRRARSAFLVRDHRAARAAAREAFRQQRTVRAAVAITGLYLSPGLLVSIYPAKNRTVKAVLRMHYRMSRRNDVGPRP
ncbi:glycosyltransferase [Mycolicibacterium moriokaense]|nr:glycosyltransferase [Mycolicibacterium moriokaense]